jgi:ribosome-associated toxin RatA of RatAB toxin-antitoxin module
MKEIRRSAIVEHSAAQMYALVDDIVAYPRFLPWCTDAKAEEIGDKKLATLTAALGGIRQSFTTMNENRPGEAIEMQLVEGPFRRFQASWRFRPLSAAACEIEFKLRYDFSSRAVSVLLGPLFSQIADTMVEAFTRRADELYGRTAR